MAAGPGARPAGDLGRLRRWTVRVGAVIDRDHLAGVQFGTLLVALVEVDGAVCELRAAGLAVLRPGLLVGSVVAHPTTLAGRPFGVVHPEAGPARVPGRVHRHVRSPQRGPTPRLRRRATHWVRAARPNGSSLSSSGAVVLKIGETLGPRPVRAHPRLAPRRLRYSVRRRARLVVERCAEPCRDQVESVGVSGEMPAHATGFSTVAVHWRHGPLR